MSHAPQLMISPDQWGVLHSREWDPLPVRRDLERETLEVKRTKWDRCHLAISFLRERLKAFAPDTILVVGDDQHENILDDNTSAFTIYVGEEVEASTSLRYFNEPKSANRTRYEVNANLAESLVLDLMEAGFDPAYSRRTRYEGGLGHAFARVLKFLMPEPFCPVVPVMVNTYYPPAPSARRCVHFGEALASSLARYGGSERVVVIGSGGLSHTKIDLELDRDFLQAIQENDRGRLEAMPGAALVEGTSEIRNWIATAAASNCAATVVDYVPLYRTATGVGCAMGFAYWAMPSS
jgi:3-O-methylgallate 3,4-dioxygenase